MQGTPWAETMPVKMRGIEALQNRPVIAACACCFNWFSEYVKCVMTFEAYAKKYWDDQLFKKLIDTAQRTSLGELPIVHNQFRVESFHGGQSCVNHYNIVMTENELKSTAQVDYVPRIFCRARPWS